MTKVIEYPVEALTFLRNDEKLALIISQNGPIIPVPESDIYLHLLRAITGQQLSTKVANVIWNRMLSLFPDSYPNPELVINTSDETFRSIGLSGQKTKYVRNVAEFMQAGKLEWNELVKMDDEAFITHLTQIKGVGRWTAEMVLMFPLDRLDVFPVDDLGIQNAMIRTYELTSTGKALKAEMITIAEAWKPYRTIASKYLWKSLNNV